MTTVSHVLASLLLAAGVALTMALFDAPTWAWLGIGLAVYLGEVKFRVQFSVAPDEERQHG